MRSSETHLSLLRRRGVIDEWHDRCIGTGREWDSAVDENLNSAAIILLLVSADFLASDYCYDRKMKRALERHDAGDAQVIPVILRPVDWQGAPFARLQALPADGVPIAAKKDRDAAFAEVAVAVRTISQEKSSKPHVSGFEIESKHNASTPTEDSRGGGSQFDVFLSHSHSDAKCVEQLACILEDCHGFRVWLDKCILPPGKLGQQEISRALTQTSVCAVCIGASTLNGLVSARDTTRSKHPK